MTMDTQVPVDCVQPSQDRPLGAYGKQGGANSWGSMSGLPGASCGL